MHLQNFKKKNYKWSIFYEKLQNNTHEPQKKFEKPTMRTAINFRSMYRKVVSILTCWVTSVNQQVRTETNLQKFKKKLLVIFFRFFDFFSF